MNGWRAVLISTSDTEELDCHIGMRFVCGNFCLYGTFLLESQRMTVSHIHWNVFLAVTTVRGVTPHCWT